MSVIDKANMNTTSTGVGWPERVGEGGAAITPLSITYSRSDGYGKKTFQIDKS